MTFINQQKSRLCISKHTFEPVFEFLKKASFLIRTFNCLIVFFLRNFTNCFCTVDFIKSYSQIIGIICICIQCMYIVSFHIFPNLLSFYMYSQFQKTLPKSGLLMLQTLGRCYEIGVISTLVKYYLHKQVTFIFTMLVWQ